MNARAAFVAFVALLTVTSVAAVPVGAAQAPPVGSSASVSTSGVGVLPSHVTPTDQTYDATAEVDIWEEGIFTLRAGDTSNDIAFSNANWFANLAGGGDKDLHKDTVRIYRTGTAIPLSFIDGRAPSGTNLANENVQLVAARLDGNQSKALSTFSTLSELQSILSKSNADANATFYGPQSATLDGSGEHTFNFNPSDPGQYIVFVASTDHGSLTVNNGDIAHNQDNVTIIGYEQFAVMGAESTVSPGASQYSAGDDVTFSVDASSGLPSSGNASHAILLYDEDTFTDETFTINSAEHLGDQWSVSNNVTLDHTVETVNGVHTSSGNPEFYGTTAEEGTSDGTPSVASILDFMVQNTTLSSSLKPTSNPVSPNTELDASLTVVNASNSTSITVGTRSDWRAACYRWVHIATNQSGVEHAADTGQVGIGTSCPTGGDGDGGDDDDDDGGAPSGGTVSTTGTYVTTSGQVDVTVADDDLTTQINVQGTTPGTSITIQRSSQQISNQLATQGSSLDEIDVPFNQDVSVSMSVVTDTAKPDPNIPDPPEDARAVGFIRVDHDAPPGAITNVRFTFRVRPSLLNQRGIDPSEVVLYRFDGSDWVALETQPIAPTPGGTLRFQAISPDGLSTFAIGARQAATPTPTPTPSPTPTPTATPTPTPTEPPTTTTETPGGLPGFTAGLALLAIALVSLLARRRR